MTTQKHENQDPESKPRDPDFVGAETAMRRAAVKARRRAFQTSGRVAVFKDGRIVWQTADEAPDAEIADDGT